MRRLSVLVLIAAAAAFMPPPPTATAAPFNVVVIMTDDQTYESLPVMRKLMSFPEGSWVDFTHAFINASICCPSRATTLTGQYSHNTGVLNNQTGNNLDDSQTLATWLHGAGYRTGLLGKYLNGYPWDRGSGYVPPGWDSFRTTTGGSDRHTNLAVDFIGQAREPYFLWQAYHAPTIRRPPRSRPATGTPTSTCPPTPRTSTRVTSPTSPRGCAAFPA